MGLATVFGIVQQNNGFIHVASAPGQGATFQLYLPRFVSAEAPEVAVETPPKPPRGKETVLLAEDEQPVRLTVQIFLAALGYTVLAAENPAQALLARRAHPQGA